jgi:hypothetical protein
MNELPPGLHGAYRVADLTRELSRWRLDKLVSEGRLVAHSRYVLVARDRQLDLHTRAAATLLMAGPRAALARNTAAYLHGCSAAPTGQIHVLVDYHRRLQTVLGVVAHQGLFEEQDVVLLDGLRVMALDHTLAELLCRESRRDALACLDQANFEPRCSTGSGSGLIRGAGGGPRFCLISRPAWLSHLRKVGCC